MAWATPGICLNFHWAIGNVRNLMRVAFGLYLLCWLAASLQAAEKGRPVSASSAQDYVHLEDWAQAHQFQVVLTRKEEEIKLTNRWTRLSFKANSQRAEINGIELFLAFPVVLHQGTLSIAQKDID